jgi:V8-like Glu-specific endopeptidase
MYFNIDNADPADDHICTAAIITRTHVLSAAHCIINRIVNETVVAVGSIVLTSARLHRISWWITYNEWCDSENIVKEFEDNDISIIKVNNSLKNLH